jgi:hypothetical protein
MSVRKFESRFQSEVEWEFDNASVCGEELEVSGCINITEDKESREISIYLDCSTFFDEDNPTDQLIFGVDQLVLPKEKMIEFLEKSLEMLKEEE